MEGKTENPIESEQQLILYEQSLELAEKIYKEFESAIRGNLQKEMDGVKEVADYPNLIEHYLRQVPEDIQERFIGHGITKAGKSLRDIPYNVQQLAMALNILQNNTLKGDGGKLKNSGHINAYTSGPFLVISKKDKSLFMFSDEYKSGTSRSPLRNEIGNIVDIGALVVNAQFYPIVDRMRELFPGVNIIRANQLPEYLNKD